jgi:hypothetical protein
LDNLDVKWLPPRIRPIKKVTFPAQEVLAGSDGTQIRIHNTDPDPEPKKTKDQKTKEKEINTAQFLFCNKRLLFILLSVKGFQATGKTYILSEVTYALQNLK